MKLLLSWQEEDWLRSSEGYVLQEALISILITALTVSITFACFSAYLKNEAGLETERRELNERISMELKKRRECFQCSQDKVLP